MCVSHPFPSARAAAPPLPGLREVNFTGRVARAGALTFHRSARPIFDLVFVSLVRKFNTDARYGVSNSDGERREDLQRERSFERGKEITLRKRGVREKFAPNKELVNIHIDTHGNDILGFYGRVILRLTKTRSAVINEID